MISKFLSGKQSGFTIIELLVIIIVIAILAGIALVAYPAYQERARDTKRKSDLQTLVNAYKLAQADGKPYSTGNLAEIFPPVANFSLNSENWQTSPSLAGNTAVPNNPGGKLGEDNYLKETIMDPKWTNPPSTSGSTYTYSGYLLIPCLDRNKGGYYAVARLENPPSDGNAFNQLMGEIEEIPSNNGNPASPASCFYYPPTGDNAAEDANLASVLIYGIIRGLTKGFLEGPNGYNYAIYSK